MPVRVPPFDVRLVDLEGRDLIVALEASRPQFVQLRRERSHDAGAELVERGNGRVRILADVIQRVPERAARGELVELGPEHGGETVPAVEAVAARENQIGKKCEALRLRGERTELAAVRVANGVQAEKS